MTSNRLWRTGGLTALVVLGAHLPLLGAPPADTAVRAASAIRVRGTITVDGRLSEPTWELAPVIGDFIQRDPQEGKPATERTEVRLAYDAEALYVGARLYDSRPGSIVRRLSRRDTSSSSDFLTIYLDPHHDHKTGVRLTVSAAGSLVDADLSNDFSSDESWDGVWDAKVVVDGTGWTLELRIPFSQLRFSAADVQTWGLNIRRFIPRINEDDWWVYVPKNDTRVVSAFGHLSGLDGIKPTRRLEVLPYANARLERNGAAVAGDPFNAGSRLVGGAGLDIKWGLTNSFSLVGAINPDFGQVEVDPAVVNLTAFETFYQEKRPFFVEGSQQFRTFGRNGLVLYGRFGATYPSLWYSRRIGRAPQAAPDGEFTRQPASTTILGAARITGRTAGGWNMSFVDAVTAREWAQVSDGGVRSSMEVEPVTNYFAARVSRDLTGRGSIGLLATAVNRQLRTAVLQQSIASAAYTGGIDGHVFLDASSAWVLSGSLAASHVVGDQAYVTRLQRASARYYQRPDASHVRIDELSTSLTGWTGQVNVNRTRGNLLVDAALWAISPGFESNDLGYSPTADRIGAHTGWLLQKTTPDKWTRERSLVLITRWLWNTAGDNLVNGYSLQASGTFRNYWSLGLNADLDLAHLDDRATRGGPMMKRPSNLSAGLYLESDSRKPVQLSLSGSYSRSASGGWSADGSPSLVFRPLPSISLSLGPSLSRAHVVAQYVTALADPTAVATFGRRTVFADLDQTEISMVARLNVIFSPKASLELYLQPLVSSGRYWDLKEFSRPRTFDFARFGHETGTIAYDDAAQAYTIDPDGPGLAQPFCVADPNFNYRSLRVNAVFRWEWRLGSTLYAVWTQQREDYVTTGEFGLGRDLRAMGGAPAGNVFMVKVAYWLSR